MTMLERFQSKVARSEDGCWLWSGTKSRTGYGRMRINEPRRMEYAHRVAYELFVGPIPAGLEIDHLCGVRSCVNPKHLRAVTHRVNVLSSSSPSGMAARQTHCKHGHPFEGDNLYVWRGTRHCRTCRTEADLRSRARAAA